MEMLMTNDISETAKAVIRRNTIEVQGGGNWELFDELFADDFHDHTPQPGGKSDKAGVLELYRRLREAFPDFTPEIHWQKADGDVVTTYKTYHGTHLGNFLGHCHVNRKFAGQMTMATTVHAATVAWRHVSIA
jgi:predicted ester cyclase